MRAVVRELVGLIDNLIMISPTAGPARLAGHFGCLEQKRCPALSANRRAYSSRDTRPR